MEFKGGAVAGQPAASSTLAWTICVVMSSRTGDHPRDVTGPA